MRIEWDDLERRDMPLTENVEPAVPTKASQLVADICTVQHARTLIGRWHSRLPTTQRGPWQLAFRGHKEGFTYCVALWNNPSARTLPSDWLELRRMAVSPDAPHCTASWFLGAMVRYIKDSSKLNPSRLISYQDLDVHTGTIYKAAGWTVGHISQPRRRDRSKPRAGTRRQYRSNINGKEPDGAGKARWELEV